jgi:DNA-binding CsgD family transcriptional regulator
MVDPTPPPADVRTARSSAVDEHAVLGAVRVLLGWEIAVVLVACLSVLAGGPGPDPDRRLGVTAVVLVAALAALALRGALAGALQRRPRGTLLCAAGLAGICFVDGAHGPSAFALSGLPLLGLASIVGSAGLAISCVLVLVLGAVGGVLLPGDAGPDVWLSGDGLANLAALVSVSVALTLLFGAFRSTVHDAERIIGEVREREPRLSRRPAPAGPGALPRADPRALLERLTTTERVVVERLADGQSAKQVAAERGVSVATVRTQIRDAKRKTGARTINELIALSREGTGAAITSESRW